VIRDKKFVVYTTASNAVSKGYLKTLEFSIAAATKYDFVDNFYVLNGQSSDGTIDELISICEKNNKVVNFESPQWPSDSWTWQILLDQYNCFLKYVADIVNETNEEVIVLYQGSDQVWTHEYALELKNAISKLIDEDYDYLLCPFRKTVNVDYLTQIYPYHHTGFTVYSAMRIRPGNTYLISGTEDKLLTNKPVKRMLYDFKTSSISYDMTFFTREQIKAKITNHSCGIKQKEVDDYIKNGFLKKCLQMKLHKVHFSEHPIELHEIISNIDDSMFGKTCFGHMPKELL